MTARFVIAALVLVAGCAAPEPKYIRIDFEHDELGQLPKSFTTALTGGGAPVAWVVSADETAPTGTKKVLVQEGADETSDRFPLCIYQGLDAADLSVTVQLKAVSGKVDQAGGIVLRYQPENYYVARANVLEENVSIFKTVKGERKLVVATAVKAQKGEWHELGFEAKGPHLKVTWDGKPVCVAEDRAFTTGKVGLWTKADSVSAFDKLRIDTLD